MLEMLNEEYLCKQLCAQVKLHSRPNGMTMLETPFTFPDGDHYPLYLNETLTGGIRISDGGHTLMHLSYENEVEKFLEGTRGQLMQQILAEQGAIYDESTGQFYLETSIPTLADAVFRLGQTLTRIYDLTFLNRSRVSSTFYDDLNEQVAALVSSERVHRNHVVPGIANAEHYPVDICIDSANPSGLPLYLFGIPSRDKARLATIFLQYYIQNRKDFNSLLVFADQQDIPRADLARLSNVGGEMIASLNAEDDFRRKLLKRVA